jgi:hypothetical protein
MRGFEHIEQDWQGKTFVESLQLLLPAADELPGLHEDIAQLEEMVASKSLLLSSSIKLAGATAFVIHVCPRTATGGVLNDKIEDKDWRGFCTLVPFTTKAALPPPSSIPGAPTISSIEAQQATLHDEGNILVRWSTRDELINTISCGWIIVLGFLITRSSPTHPEVGDLASGLKAPHQELPTHSRYNAPRVLLSEAITAQSSATMWLS